MRPIFVQFRCEPGRTYEVADAIYDRELVSEAKIYLPEGEDVGRYLAEHLFDIPGISRTLTTITFKAF